MKKIDFTQQGGFPLTQDTLGWMQNGYGDVLKAFGKWLGPLVILEGCANTQGRYSEGWVAVDGEVMYKAAGYGEAVTEHSEPLAADYHDGTTRYPYENKTLIHGTGGNPLRWMSQFKRLDTFSDAMTRIANSWQKGGDNLTANSVIGDISSNGRQIDFKTKGITRFSLFGNPNANEKIAGFAGDILVGRITVGSGNNSSNANTSVGEYAGNSQTAGYGNSNFGWRSGFSLTEGGYNCNFGILAGYYLTAGRDNVNIGYYAGGSTVAGSGNIRIGTSSGVALGDVSNSIVIQGGSSWNQHSRVMMNSAGNWGFGTNLFSDIQAKLHVVNSNAGNYVQKWTAANGASLGEYRNDGALNIRGDNSQNDAIVFVGGTQTGGRFVVRAAAHVNRSADNLTSAFIADSTFKFRPSSNLVGDFANYFSYPYFEIPAGVSVDKFSAYGCSAYTPIRGGGALRRYYAFYDAGTNIAGMNYSAYFANNVGIGLENPTAKLQVSGNIMASA